MKIVLCIFLLFITALSVFGEPQELNGIVGKSIEFPAAVKIEGNLRYSGVPIGDVTGGSFKRARSKFSGRLQWDSSTGLFSLSELRLEDSGVYTVQDTHQNINTVFQLNVYKDNVVELNGIKNTSIEFQTKVGTIRKLKNSSKTVIGEINVQSGKLLASIDLKYQGRVHWDSSTQRFSLSGLRLEDSGVYTVENTDGQSSVSTFNLTVWVNVSKPHLSVTRNEYRCTVLCAAARGTGATLTLYREGETNPYVTSPVRSDPHLDMTHSVESGTYTCEAKNSVSRETSDPLTVEAHCTVTAPSGLSAGTIAAIIIVVLIVALIAVVLAVLYQRIKRKLEAVREKKRAAKRKLEVTGSELEDTTGKLVVTGSELEDTRSKLKDTRSELEDTASELEVTKGKLDDTRSELEVTKGKLDDTRSELEDTRSELEVTKGKLDVTRSKLEDVGRMMLDKDKQALIQDAVRSLIKELRGPAK